jgi:hypothetical protein
MLTMLLVAAGKILRRNTVTKTVDKIMTAVENFIVVLRLFLRAKWTPERIRLTAGGTEDNRQEKLGPSDWTAR